MADMHEHPAIGIVIARLEDRDEDAEELMGIHQLEGATDIDVTELEKACHDLADFASFLAVEAYHHGGSNEGDLNNEEHKALTVEFLKGIALRMPLIEGG
jgi:hypothetical protein